MAEQTPPQNKQTFSEEIISTLCNQNNGFGSLLYRIENAMSRLNDTELPKQETEPTLEQPREYSLQEHLNIETKRYDQMLGDLEILVRGLEAFV